MKPLILTFIALTCLASTAVRGETRVTFNASGIAQVNGKPFFPIGIWTYEITPATLNDLRSKHFNTVIGNGFKPGDVDAIYKAGMMSVPFATKEYLPLKDHDGLLSWYVTDEPEGHGNTPDDIKKLREQLHQADPNHPGENLIEQLPTGEWIERAPYFEAVAVTGDGVFDTLKAVSKLVLKLLA